MAEVDRRQYRGACGFGDFKAIGMPLSPNLNFSTAHHFISMESLLAYHENKFQSFRYMRDSSPLAAQLETYLSAVLEGRCVTVFDSGMSAISATIGALVSRKSKVFTIGSIYRKTQAILDRMQARFGVLHVNFDSVDCIDRDDAEIVVFLESPSNPFLRLANVREVRKKLPNARIVLDITFQGLLNSTGIDEFVDVIVSSCTKYIGGHNDVFGGFAATTDSEIRKNIWEERSTCGGILDNLGAFLIIRSLQTYDLRMEKTIANTDLVLDFLASSPEVKSIFYPGRFQNADQADQFRATQHHGGGVVTFELVPEIDISKNLSRLKSIKMAPSFGSVNSLIEMPSTMSHWGKSRAELEKIGLNDRILRLSVGHEPFQDIKNDLVFLFDGGRDISSD